MKIEVEPVMLADGPAMQAVVPWVQLLDQTAEAIAKRRLETNARWAAQEPMAEGGLFDEVAKAQLSLF